MPDRGGPGGPPKARPCHAHTRRCRHPPGPGLATRQTRFIVESSGGRLSPRHVRVQGPPSLGHQRGAGSPVALRTERPPPGALAGCRLAAPAG